ncbi:peptidyl-dipeptidase Dcp [Acerihabitans sp. TG2]|uniref:peptidyl-dipeptidase Dcp n=1 Tax=Acerihabitans sp. TG2 TaxID=3096008 RepID=UPI002B23D4EC|nr:peptidyl-dipeptidase Dcp [Acerihabitans sp. TG2]MEA9393385.1 peptidyl-dipeptidase Dcp [Acerihabitans sp. TG2]
MASIENPFYQASSLPFQAPPFDLIKEDDYALAIEEGARAYLAEVEHIAHLRAEPTFDNTYLALECAGQVLKRTLAVFGAMTSANTNKRLQQIEEETSPKLAKLHDAINLNHELFIRLQQVYDQRLALELCAESLRLIELTYQHFVLAGARLSSQEKAQLSQLNQEAASVSTRFTHSLLAASKQGAVVITDEKWLAGLSAAEINAASLAAKERGLEDQWLLALQNTTQQPPLQSLTHRDSRRTLFTASVERAEQGDDNDTRKLIARLAQIRAQQAKLLGFADYASWALQDQMAKTPAAALTFMQNIVPAATARAKREAADIQALIDDQPDGGALAPWDWQFYADRVRNMKYKLNDAQVRPYFPLDSVLHDGVFYAASQLYGITLRLRRDIPVYHDDVNVYEVFDHDGTSLALFYTDYFQRDNKGGGAWMGNFIEQSTMMKTRPVMYNVANFPKPPVGETALLSWDDVITLFHEFGHTLHGLFAKQHYASLSGTATPRDFVEFPSQLNEHWADDPAVFANYAKHYKTGEPMPDDLRDNIKRAAQFNQGYDMTELLAAALLDMHWHRLTADQPLQQVNEFESAVLAMEKVSLAYVPPRYRSSYFQHIWGGGYAAGYYAYLWTQMLADDAFDAFKEQGGLTAQNGRRFRDSILSRGNSEDLDQLYRAWRGSEPNITPMLINRGLQKDD